MPSKRKNIQGVEASGEAKRPRTIAVTADLITERKAIKYPKSSKGNFEWPDIPPNSKAFRSTDQTTVRWTSEQLGLPAGVSAPVVAIPPTPGIPTRPNCKIALPDLILPPNVLPPWEEKSFSTQDTSLTPLAPSSKPRIKKKSSRKYLAIQSLFLPPAFQSRPSYTSSPLIARVSKPFFASEPSAVIDKPSSPERAASFPIPDSPESTSSVNELTTNSLPPQPVPNPSTTVPSTRSMTLDAASPPAHQSSRLNPHFGAASIQNQTVYNPPTAQPTRPRQTSPQPNLLSHSPSRVPQRAQRQSRPRPPPLRSVHSPHFPTNLTQMSHRVDPRLNAGSSSQAPGVYSPPLPRSVQTSPQPTPFSVASPPPRTAYSPPPSMSRMHMGPQHNPTFGVVSSPHIPRMAQNPPQPGQLRRHETTIWSGPLSNHHQ